MSENMNRDQGETPEVTAVQFPKLEPSDLPKNEGAIEDIPFEDDLPLLEEDRPLDKGFLYNWVYKMDDRQFNRVQIIFGLILGLIGGIALYYPAVAGLEIDQKSSTWSMVALLAVVMFIPRFVERKIEKRIARAQTAMIITLLVLLVAFVVFSLLTGRFTQAA